MSFRFELLYQSKKSHARVGRIHTPHGIIDTPCFVPVGTNAVVKAVDSKVLEQIDLQLIFCNTYHLLLQPGLRVIEQAGGLHNFMGRHTPIITDSGGFQVFSLAYGSVYDELKSRGTKKLNNTVVRVTEEGVTFRSYRDGSLVTLTPESSVQAQKILGADIILPLDELLPYHARDAQLRESFERTHRWQKRSLDEHLKNQKKQAIFAIIHGGTDDHLRARSAALLSQMPFDGFAIGGSLGKNLEQMAHMLHALMPHVPAEKPRHLLGIGEHRSIETIIKLGIDTFDSSYPTRCARHGLLLTNAGPQKILNARYKFQQNPIDPSCACATCTRYSASYLQHLFKAHELTAYTLATIHNLYFMNQFVLKIRQGIQEDLV